MIWPTCGVDWRAAWVAPPPSLSLSPSVPLSLSCVVCLVCRLRFLQGLQGFPGSPLGGEAFDAEGGPEGVGEEGGGGGVDEGDSGGLEDA